MPWINAYIGPSTAYTTLPNSSTPVIALDVDNNPAATRRKTRVTRQPRTQVSQVSQVPQVPTPAIPPTPTTRSRRRIPDDEMEVEQDTIPVSERRFFDRVLILASSFIIG